MQTGQVGGVDSWYGLYDVAHQDITYGTNAVLKGHMIFESEYEKVLSFIDSNNANYSSRGHLEKQQTVAHESGIIKEGQTNKEIDTVNNIVDLEGNLWEWTTQAYYTVRNRIARGGNYGSSANGNFRSTSEIYKDAIPIDSYMNYGVRQSLYVAL